MANKKDKKKAKALTMKELKARCKKLKRENKKLRAERDELAEEVVDLVDDLEILTGEDDEQYTFVGYIGDTKLCASKSVEFSMGDMDKLAMKLALLGSAIGVRFDTVAVEHDIAFSGWNIKEILDLLCEEPNDGDAHDGTNPEDSDAETADADSVSADDSDDEAEESSLGLSRNFPADIAMIAIVDPEDDEKKLVFSMPVWRLQETEGVAVDVVRALTDEIKTLISQVWLSGEIDLEKAAQNFDGDEIHAACILEIVQTLDEIIRGVCGISLDEARVIGMHKAHPELTQAEVGAFLGANQHTVARTISDLVLGWKRVTTKKKAQAGRADEDAEKAQVEQEARDAERETCPDEKSSIEESSQSESDQKEDRSAEE